MASELSPPHVPLKAPHLFTRGFRSELAQRAVLALSYDSIFYICQFPSSARTRPSLPAIEAPVQQSNQYH